MGISLSDNIIATKEQYPCLTCAEIGRRHKCSREYVRLVLTRSGYSTSRPSKHCLNCGALLPRKSTKQLFCSQQCYRNYHKVPVSCSYCGKITYRLASSVLRYPSQRGAGNYRFCNRVCMGKFVGEKYGFGR